METQEANSCMTQCGRMCFLSNQHANAKVLSVHHDSSCCLIKSKELIINNT
jgi:hypothetical protein